MKNTTTSELIYNQIRQQILEKKLFPGSHIVEDNIARDAGVSRAAVRAVMNRLQTDGYVRIIPNKGSFVISPTVDEIKMLYNTRLYLELGVASLAVKNVTPDIIERMEANYEAQKLLKARFSIVEYAVLNRDFHWAIAEASHNEYYKKFLSEIYNIGHVYLVFYDDSVDNSRSLYTHGQMLQALHHRDEQELMAAIRLDNANAFDDLNADCGCGV